MLLLDLQFGTIIMRRERLAHMLTAASLLIAKHCKSEEEVTLRDWIKKVTYMCLISKIIAIIRYRLGKYNTLREFKVKWK